MNAGLDWILNANSAWPWAGYPLSVVQDGKRETSDLSMAGFLPLGSPLSIRLLLDPLTSYRFDVSGSFGSMTPASALVEASTGRLAWANPSALAALGVGAPEALVLGGAVVTGAFASQYRLLLGSAEEVRSMAGLPPSTPGTGPLESSGITMPAYSLTVAAESSVLERDGITRFVKINSGQYFYTADRVEADLIRSTMSEFRDEGEAFQADASERAGWLPVFRYADLKTGGYFYTASVGEASGLSSLLRFEGVAFWTPPASESGVMPIYRLRNIETGGYLLTSSSRELAYALLQGNWRSEGVVFHALAEEASAFRVPLSMMLEPNPLSGIDGSTAVPLIEADSSAGDAVSVDWVSPGAPTDPSAMWVL